MKTVLNFFKKLKELLLVQSFAKLWLEHASIETYQILPSVLVNAPKGKGFWKSICGAFYTEPLDIGKEQQMNHQLRTLSHTPCDYEIKCCSIFK